MLRHKACFLLLLLLLFPFLTAKALDTSSEVDVVTDEWPLGIPFQEKLHFAQGLYWIFYANGTRLMYATSSDLITWSKRDIRASTNGYNDAFTFDGNTVHYTQTGDALYYRKGTLNADGTITWAAAEQTIEDEATITYQVPTIAIVNASPFVTYRKYDGAQWSYWCAKSSTNNGIWTNDTGFPYELNSATVNYWQGKVVGLSDDTAVFMYLNNTHIFVRTYASGVMSAATETNLTLTWNTFAGSIQAYGTSAYFVWTDNAGDLRFRKWTEASGWGSETVISNAVGSISSDVISVDSSNKTLYCFFVSNIPNTLYYETYNLTSDTWNTPAINWYTEYPPLFWDGTWEDCYRIACSSQNYGDEIIVGWVSIEDSILHLRMKVFTEPSTEPPPESYEEQNPPGSGETGGPSGENAPVIPPIILPTNITGLTIPFVLPKLGTYGIFLGLGLVVVGGIMYAVESSGNKHSPRRHKTGYVHRSRRPSQAPRYQPQPKRERRYT